MFGKRKRHNRRVKEEIIMEQVMKHYGNAILAIIVLLALGAIIIAALSSDGYVATEFKNARIRHSFCGMRECAVRRVKRSSF